MSEENEVIELPQPTKTIKCVIVPVDIMDQVQDALKEAPYKLARSALQQLGGCMVQDVEVMVNEPNRNPNQE